MEKLVNPLAQTPEWKALAKQYKTNLLKYQPGPNWYFSGVATGVDFNNTLLTIEWLRAAVKRVSPIGPAVPVMAVKDVTFTYEELCEIFPQEMYFGTSYNWNSLNEWLEAQDDIFHYGRGREDFHIGEGYDIASKLGYSKIYFEDFS